MFPMYWMFLFFLLSMMMMMMFGLTVQNFIPLKIDSIMLSSYSLVDEWL